MTMKTSTADLFILSLSQISLGPQLMIVTVKTKKYRKSQTNKCLAFLQEPKAPKGLNKFFYVIWFSAFSDTLKDLETLFFIITLSTSSSVRLY